MSYGIEKNVGEIEHHVSDIVTASSNAANMGGSQIYLSEGEKITVEDLMKGISVASGNDATVAMAEYISGSFSSISSFILTLLKVSLYLSFMIIPPVTDLLTYYGLWLIA